MTGRKRQIFWVAVLALALGACGGSDVPSTASPDVAQTEESPVDPTAVRPFRVAVPEAVLEDLRDRLERTRFPDEIPGSDWGDGFELAYLRELVAYWKDEFDWRREEEAINSFDQFKTVLDGMDIHFIHERSPVEGATPLLLIHGWPGSYLEFLKVIGPLTDPVAHGGTADDAFHVVVPSLPGYGFSDKPKERGWGPAQMGDLLVQLMERLGYERYGLQGGDWGSFVARRMAAEQPDRVIGLHLNMLIVSPPEGEDPRTGMTAAEGERFLERTAHWADKDGYYEIQSKRPQTLGYALNDSPAGLAAWLVDLYQVLCDCPSGRLEDKFTKDELLANVTLYWLTESPTSAARIYYEAERATPAMGPRSPVLHAYIDVPTAGALFPKDVFLPPRSWAERRFNIVQWTVMPRGGHFAALEEPELLVEDVRRFFGAVSKD